VWGLEDLGIFVAIVRGDYDNTTEAGRSRMRKEADRAEDERIIIRDRTQGGRQEKAEVGGHDGGPAPYPYRIEDQGKRGESRLVLDKGDGHEGYPTLHRAYAYIVFEGKAPSEIEDLFTAEGVPGPSGGPWPRGSLRHVLTGRAVQESKRIFRDPKGHKTKLGPDGTPLYGDTVVIDLEPVFTPDQLKLLNLALARTARGPRTSEKDIHPLSRHIFGLCGVHYTGASKTGRRQVPVYRCANKQHLGHRGQKRCACVQIDAETIENRVWTEVCRLLEDPKRLNSMAEDWIETVKSNGVDYKARIVELDEQIDEKEVAIDAVTAATAVRARRRGLDKQAAQEAIERATGGLEEELKSLEELRNEAINWQAEMDQTVDRAKDLQALSDLARVQLHAMNARQKEDIVDLLDLKITLLGPVPRRATRKGDTISAWFRERERVVPLITDEAWVIAERIMHHPTGRRASNPRALLDAILTKARTGCAWTALEYGNVASIYKRWVHNGVWEELMEALADFPGTPVSDDIVLPPLRIEGRVDPRLLLSNDESPDEDDPFKATSSGAISFLMKLAA
jgi:transposase